MKNAACKKIAAFMVVLALILNFNVAMNSAYADSQEIPFVYPEGYLNTDGIPGIVEIEPANSGGTIDIGNGHASVDDAEHRLKVPAIVDHYANLYKSYKFGNVITVIDSERYKTAANNVVFSTSDKNSYISNKVTINKNNPQEYDEPGSASYWSYIHELTHKIEDDNGDVGYTAGITKYSRAYGERNIEFMESILSDAISILERFERDIEKEDFVQAEVRWKAFIAAYEDAIQTKHTEASGAAFSPDFKLLKNWIGFNVDRYEIENYYKSGNAGEKFKRFFERDLGKKTTLNSLKAGSYVSITGLKFSVVDPLRGYIMYSTYKADISGMKSSFAENSAIDNVDPYTLRTYLDKWYNDKFPDDQKILVRDFLDDKFNKAGVISLNDYKKFLKPINFSAETPIWLDGSYAAKDGGGNLIRISYPSLYWDIVSWGAATEVWNVAPALYLNPATPMLSGAGSYDDPYIISKASNTNTTAGSSTGSIERPVVTPPSIRTYPTGLPGLDFANNPPPALYINSTIKLRISDTKATINNRDISIDVAPEIKENRTFVPLRFIAESLGAKVDYIPDYKGSKTIVISGASNKQEDYIILFVGSKNVLHNQVTEKMENAPYIKDGRTLIPLRGVCEKLGADIEWDGNKREITIKR